MKLLLLLLNSFLFPALAQEEVRNFVPLSCNRELGSCQPWTAVFGDDPVHQSRLVIPCGECVWMDYPHDSLTLEQGIDVTGRLEFPEREQLDHLTIYSPFVQVQGELIMEAVQKPVDGTFDYRFVLTGEEDNYLMPIDENFGACRSEQCNVGTKAIAVAGGRVDIRGIPVETPSWVHLFDTIGDSDTSVALVVDDAVAGKWERGADIVVTSHTMAWDGQQERRIANVVPSKEHAGYVNVYLDNPIIRPTSVLDSAEFAVEVALLSRNIQFVGGSDSDDLRGGQLVFFHTPEVSQLLEGVEIRNFGQQGYLGKYPIHFHFCDNSRGTIVSKNTIRQSNQRCVVIHGTNYMRVEGNVAYDTKGHCFLLEDGHETWNQLVGNLGVMTGTVERTIPNHGRNGYETDRLPSTFWITNPTNVFIGNVAAGSQDSGFWFELKVRGDRAYRYPRLDPRRLPLLVFKNNVAHSNKNMGIRAYPSGYRPDLQSSIEDFQAYRNHLGAFFHLSRNIRIVGGLFADNRKGLEIDRTDNIDVEGTLFVGVTDEWKRLETSQQVKPPCFRNEVLGIEYHGWKNEPKVDGCTFSNVTFSHYQDTGCHNGGTAVMIDDRHQVPLFDLFTTFESVRFEEASNKMNMCPSIGVGFTPFHTDLDGSFAPFSDSNAGPASLVGNAPTLTHFLDTSLCENVSSGCYFYCPKTCFRGIRYNVNPSGTKDYRLKVCSNVDSENCVAFPGYLRPRDEERKLSTRPRVFMAYLPTGKYTAVFVDSKGLEVWPTYVEEVYQSSEVCPDSLKEGDVVLREPQTQVQCMELIQNGDMQNSNSELDPWLYRFGGIKLAQHQGQSFTNAMTSKQRKSSNTLMQYLDSQCLAISNGTTYNIEMWFKFIDQTGRSYSCNRNLGERCPEFWVWGTFGRMRVETKLSGPNEKGFQRLNGSTLVTEAMARSQQVGIYIRSNQPKIWFIDNVKMSLVSPNLSLPIL